MAFAHLLKELGIRAEAAVCGSVNNETRFALETFGLPSPSTINNIGGRRAALVDHSSYAQAAEGVEKAEITQLLD